MAYDSNGMMKPAWVLRHLLADKMVEEVYRDPRLRAVSYVHLDSTSSCFQVHIEPIQEKTFELGAKVFLKFSYQVISRKEVRQRAKALFSRLEQK